MEFRWTAEQADFRNHVRAAYDKAKRLPERRKMMQAWADYLDGLRAGANVVPFKRMAG